MAHPPHRPSQRNALLNVALNLVRQGGAPTLDAVARAGEVSKPGLMYHFPSKVALLTALVDHVIDGFEDAMADLVDGEAADVAPHARLTAYLRWSTTYEHDAADLVMLSDPKLRVPMTERWAQRIDAWVRVDADLPEAERARLHAIRLLADGAWYAEATGVGALSPQDRLAVLEVGLNLLNGAHA